MENVAPQSLRRQLRFCTIPVAILIWLVHLPLRHPALDPSHMSNDGNLALICVLVVAYGLAGYLVSMVGLLAWHRRRFLRLYTRLRIWRAVLAIALTIVTPSGFFFIFPLFAHILWFNTLMQLLHGQGVHEDSVPHLIVSAITFPVWYVVSGLIISSVNTSRWRRGMAFFIAWLGMAALVFLFHFYPFHI